MDLFRRSLILCIFEKASLKTGKRCYFYLFISGWAHVVCALYIPEVQFANVSTMEPIVLQSVPHDRYNKVQ